MKSQSEASELEQLFLECLPFAGPWMGTLFRSTAVEYANRDDLLTGEGARQSGGRWNPPGMFRTVYGCLEPETAMSESLANYRGFKIHRGDAARVRRGRNQSAGDARFDGSRCSKEARRNDSPHASGMLAGNAGQRKGGSYASNRAFGMGTIARRFVGPLRTRCGKHEHRAVPGPTAERQLVENRWRQEAAPEGRLITLAVPIQAGESSARADRSRRAQ